MSEQNSFLNVFQGIDDSVQKKRITKPGIYEKSTLIGCEFTEVEADLEKKKNAYKCILLKFAIPDPEDNSIAEFEERIFAPATTAADVKYLAKKFVKGVHTGENTPEEQIKKDHEDVAIHLMQLIKAFGKTYAAAQQELLPFVNVPIENAFVSMGKGFVGLYANGRSELIDIKIVYRNSDKNKTSQLVISQPASNNISYSQHIPGQKTKLQFTDYEVKSCMKRKYTGQDAAPTSDASLMGYTPPPANDAFGVFSPAPATTAEPFTANPTAAGNALF